MDREEIQLTIIIRKNKAGRNRYTVQAYHNGERLPAKTFGTRKEAKDYEMNIGKEYNGTAKIIFDKVIEEYKQNHLNTVTPGTRKRYMLDLDRRIMPYFTGMNLDDITPKKIEQFRSTLIDSELSDKSINNCTDLLKSIFKKCVEYGYLDHSPHRIKKLKLEKKEAPWWSSIEDVKRFKASVKGHQYEAAFLLALDLGLRISEIVGLSKQDIDWKRGNIKIHRQWDEDWACYSPLKNKTERHLSFDKDSQLGQSLLRAVTESNHIECIFITSTGQRVLPRRLGNGIYHNARSKAGCPKIGFHGLRHTYASWFAREGGDLFQLKYNLGHSDLATTMRYAHHAPKAGTSQVKY
jgi:integrase